ncbi:hypothetical protein L1987_85234 [Smallanthus sonchifolius]|uniref:Uncharacterized protein n=1 Tax=Smallanthus sonchifolius TaxID=185202 RepID=A0ACB8XVW9_9ASTR|nr:hypothetical protein L1987_85234 [Smallanthus sonchifolius]
MLVGCPDNVKATWSMLANYLGVSKNVNRAHLCNEDVASLNLDSSSPICSKVICLISSDSDGTQPKVILRMCDTHDVNQSRFQAH